jgi:hypothetical protein
VEVIRHVTGYVRIVSQSGREALRAGDPATAVQLLRRASSLWRGRPLAEVDLSEPFGADLRGLELRYLDLVEDRVAAEFDLGRHADLAPTCSGWWPTTRTGNGCGPT